MEMENRKVTLRKKAISKGRLSLYLDIYPPILNKKTNKLSRREFLNLYIFDKPKNETQRISNIKNLRTAELIQIRKQTELNKENIYSVFEREQLRIQEIGQTSFLQYFKKLRDKKEGVNLSIWESAVTHFEKFLNGQDLLFKEVTITLLEDYRDYLLKAKSLRNNNKKIAKNTALSYYNKLKNTLKKAFKDDLLQKDLNASIPSIKEQESQRNFLTLEEAKKLFSTHCQNETVYRVSKLSVLTGLRYSDISKLLWTELEFIEGDGYYIRFQQKKTEGLQTMPISQEAFELLGTKKEKGGKVFPNLKKWEFDRVIPVWIAQAGIGKHITFHCFRHTYATLQIATGTEIFTVSKMLGHKNVKTTQIYTKIINSKKRETTYKISFK